MRVRFSGTVWMHTGEAAWYFVTLPPDAADDIAHRAEPSRRGFGSVRVTATIGQTTWQTSIFPDRAAGSYLLPVKKQVRAAEGLDDGSTAQVTLVVEP